MKLLSSKAVWIINSVVAVILIPLFSFVTEELHAETLKIGVILHLTGDLSAQSHSFLKGIEYAVHQANIEERTRKISLFVEDGKNSAQASAIAAHKLVAIDRVDAVIVSSYLDAMANGPLFERARIPSIVLWDSSPEIEKIGEYTFSIGPWIPSSGKAAAHFSFSTLKAKRAAVVYSEDPFSESAASIFIEQFKRLGGETIESVRLPHSNDFRSIISRLKTRQIDVLYTPVVTHIIPFYSQLKQLKNPIPAISCNVITSQHINEAPSVFEGVYHTMIADPDDKATELFSRGFREWSGEKLSHPWFVTTGFDAVNLILDGAEKSDGSSEGIRKVLSNTKHFPGVARTITMTSGGSAAESEEVFEIRNRRFQRAKNNIDAAGSENRSGSSITMRVSVLPVS